MPKLTRQNSGVVAGSADSSLRTQPDITVAVPTADALARRQTVRSRVAALEKKKRVSRKAAPAAKAAPKRRAPPRAR